MPKISTNISLDPQLKKQANELFANFGLDLSTAITIFLSQSVREQRIPFEIRMDSPNRQTLEAMSELPKMKEDKENYKRYDSFAEAMKEVL